MKHIVLSNHTQGDGMVFIATRVLILTSNLRFAMQIAQALERPGAFTVATFTSAENALTYLRENARDVLLLDMTLRGLNPAVFVNQVRAVQSDIAILAMPEKPEIRQLVSELNLQGIVDFSDSARKLVPILKAAQKKMYEAQPDTTRMPAQDAEKSDAADIKEKKLFSNIQEDVPTKMAQSMPLELVLNDEDGETSLQVSQAAPEVQLIHDADAAVSIFQRLAAEEPPMPGFEDSATVHDLMAAAAHPDRIKQIVATFNEEDTSPGAAVSEEAAISAEDSRQIPATLILATTEDSTPLDGFSLEEFLRRIHDQMRATGLAVQPLPSWVEESEKYVREPDFLPENLPMLDPYEPIEYTPSPTTPSSAQWIEPAPGELDTEQQEPISRSRPVTDDDMAATIHAELAEAPAQSHVELPPTEVIVELAEPEIIEPEIAAPEITENYIPPVRPTLPEVVLPTPAIPPGTDPRSAQMALVLTQLSLETTAEATVLIKQGEVIGRAGVLPNEDIDDIVATFGSGLEAAPTQGRIRFIVLPATGAEYMLYSRGVEGGFTLSMIFSGNMPLQAIRRQGKRMADALLAVPEIDIPVVETRPDETAAPPEILVDAGVLAPHTYLWLLQNEDAVLDDNTRTELSKRLTTYLRRQGWKVHTLDTGGDYVYLYADVPESKLNREHIRDLMQQSTDIISHVAPQFGTGNLWADGYLVLLPGRELRADEIQEFIHFMRV